jgi:hypothetical protein
MGRSTRGEFARFWENVVRPTEDCPGQSRQTARRPLCRAAPWPRLGRPVKHDVETWRVVDDWLERVPVTDAEIDVFEAWFGNLFDELFGPSR